MVAVILALLLAGVRLIGLTPYCVLSGSMEPQYHTGSLIYVKSVDPSEVKAGDVITFVLNEDLAVATHQVYDIDSENQYFYTQGIANLDSEGNIQPDANPVYFGNLIGMPVFTIPYLGYVSNYITTAPGIYIMISAAIVIILLTFLPDLFKKAAASDNKEKADK